MITKSRSFRGKSAVSAAICAAVTPGCAAPAIWSWLVSSPNEPITPPTAFSTAPLCTTIAATSSSSIACSRAPTVGPSSSAAAAVDSRAASKPGCVSSVSGNATPNAASVSSTASVSSAAARSFSESASSIAIRSTDPARSATSPFYTGAGAPVGERSRSMISSSRRPPMSGNVGSAFCRSACRPELP